MGGLGKLSATARAFEPLPSQESTDTKRTGLTEEKRRMLKALVTPEKDLVQLSEPDRLDRHRELVARLDALNPFTKEAFLRRAQAADSLADRKLLPAELRVALDLEGFAPEVPDRALDRGGKTKEEYVECLRVVAKANYYPLLLGTVWDKSHLQRRIIDVGNVSKMENGSWVATPPWGGDPVYLLSP
jgi:hypothetical protein